jgi:iron uptake system component EfeO
MKHHRLTLVAVAALALPLAACTTNNADAESKSDGTITIKSTDDACDVSTASAPSGNLVFKVSNAGSKVTEFYLYGEDGLRIVGEVENVGPGLSRDLVVHAVPGDYITACKPGMVGKGIRDDFTVTDSGKDTDVKGVDQELIDTANAQYAAYVEDQTEQLLAGTQEFVTAYKNGEDDKARELYPLVRVHWERIEPVAESFGDLDPKMDLREADLEPGQKWTGWHRIEKDLWWPADQPKKLLTPQQRATFADDLLANTEELKSRVAKTTFTVDQIGNGAKSLLDEVATGKITGEEEIWSHTDLYDFQANVDGARVAFEGLRPVLHEKDPALEKELEQRFTALQDLLDQHRVGRDGFVTYTELSKAEVKQLSDAVNALSEPLSKLTAAVAL